MATSPSSQGKRGAWKRVNLSEIEPIWLAAEQLLIPKEQSQRKAFEALVPYIFNLRNKGCSWDQLTKLVVASGINLQPSTVRSYYSEMLATRQDICQARMTEQILLLADVRKDNEQKARASISEKLARVLERTAPATSAKIDSFFGLTGAAPAAPVAQKVASPMAPRADAGSERKPEASPASAESPGPTDDGGGFGLLYKSAAPNKAQTTPPAFFTDDLPIPPKSLDAPEPKKIDGPISKFAAPAPLVGSDSSAASAAGEKLDGVVPPILAGGLRCAPLQKDVPELPNRAGVDPHMYEDVVLEHPHIPGLFLTRAERLYGLALEIIDADGAIRLESADEKRFRVKWMKPIPRTPSSTEGDFAKMDMSLFANGGKRK